MGFIGRPNIYGLFEKQLISPVSGQHEYQLFWQAGSASSLLVVQDGTVLEPFEDFALGLDGRTIVFTNDPFTHRTFVVYLGRELSVPRTVGIEPKVDMFIADGQTQTFTLSVGPVNQDSVIVFQNQYALEPVNDYSVSGNQITFTAMPLQYDVIRVHIHGVERFDILAIEDYSITDLKLHADSVTRTKIAMNAVSADKLDINWSPWPGEDFITNLETFNGMDIIDSQVFSSLYSKMGNHVKIKLDFVCTFDGIPDNILRYKLPFGPNADDIVPGCITIQTSYLTETGIQTWGGLQQCDIQRPGGINYTLNTEWRFKVRCEYDLNL